MKFISICLTAMALAGLQNAFAIELVTSEEALSSQQAAMLEAELTAPDPLGPTIQLLDPEGLDKPLKNPFKMEVLFKPQQGAALDFSTFKALYGTFKIDITDRLMKEAVKSASSIRLANVDVPSGRHKLLISIKDNLGHTTVKEIAFRVE
jgi:hypothetical protein